MVDRERALRNIKEIIEIVSDHSGIELKKLLATAILPSRSDRRLGVFLAQELRLINLDTSDNYITLPQH